MTHHLCVINGKIKMTRQELDEWNVCLERPDARVMKDVIFDYFESRTCENCKHLQKYTARLHNRIGICGNDDCSFVTDYVEVTDGCLKWSSRDD